MNEIYKGMDNAAEQINENFQNGSIVESGSYEGGFYVKYGDGTMKCYSINLMGSLTTSVGALVRSRGEYWNFAEGFIEPPLVFANATNPNRWANATSTTIGFTRIVQWGAAVNATETDAYAFAIGRWK